MSSAYSAPVLISGARELAALKRLHLTETSGDFDEAWLQNLIDTCPNCLPIDEIEPGFERVISICREMPTKHGPIDNFLMTPEGDLVLVETKLWRNPEARRKVVAQALDYASCLFEMDYAALEQSVLKGDFAGRKKPARLYDLFPDADAKAEAAFVDTVNANLRKGRALILVVGDGIRTEAARLTSLLQSHAGARFTFALVELAIFQLPGNQGLMACPRIHVQTEMIERGVIQIDDRRAVVLPPDQPVTAAQGEAAPKSISAEQFYESMAAIDPILPRQIQAFLARLEPLGVYPEYLKSLNLKWDPPEGRAFNLGYIKRSGHLWTDAANWAGRVELGHDYNQRLAAALGVTVDTQSKVGWYVVRPSGGAPRIDEIAPKFDDWYAVIQSFIPKIQQWGANGSSPGTDA